jgi:hypothetical protein
MRVNVSTARRLGLLLLVALSPALPATGPATAQAATDGGAGGPQKLWRMYPLGPRRGGDRTSHPPARPDRTPHATASHATASPEHQTRLRDDSGGWDVQPLVWLLGLGAAAAVGAAAVVGVRRSQGDPQGAGIVNGRAPRPPATPAARSRATAVPPARARPSPDLSHLSRSQLYQLAVERGIDGRSRMTRERLIEALDDHRPRGGPT